MKHPILFLTLVLGLVACSSDRNGGRTGSGDGGSTPMNCTMDSDCDDMIDCTTDTCGVGGVCRHSGIDERCPDGEICQPGRGCGPEPECSMDSDCDDMNDCTEDVCGVDEACRHTPIDERCPGGQSCDPAMGCINSGRCTMDSDCDDMIDCTEDTCGVDMMCIHTPINERCPDGQSCAPGRGCFESMPCMNDEECDDGDFCNGREWCMPEFGCQPAREPRVCDDSDMCTVDSCSEELNMCVFTCDSSMPECGCPVETPCGGTFELSPVPTQTCALGMVNYSVMRVEFSCPAGILSVRAGVPSAGMDTPLTQAPRPMGADFNVSAEIAGGCTETFRLQGSFTGPDTFTGTFTSMFTDSDGFSCALGGCAPLTFSVTGTRI